MIFHKKTKQLLDDYFQNDCSIADIAKKHGLSRQYVHAAVNRHCGPLPIEHQRQRYEAMKMAERGGAHDSSLVSSNRGQRMLRRRKIREGFEAGIDASRLADEYGVSVPYVRLICRD